MTAPDVLERADRPSRPGPTLVAWAAAGALAALGVAATLAVPAAPPVPPGTPDDLAAFGPPTLERVDEWVGPLRTWFPLRLLVGLAVPAWLVLSARGRRVLSRVAGGRLPTFRAAAAVLAAAELADLPFAVALDHVHATGVGLATGGPGRFLVDRAMDAAVGVVVTATVVAGVLALVRARPRDWPPFAVVGATGVGVLLVVLEPLVTTRLAYDPVPLDDPRVAAAVEPVLAASGPDAPRLVVGAASVRTTRVNAYATGAGPTSTIVVWDTLLQQRALDEVVAVVAHEVAHAEAADPLRGVLAVAPAALLLALPARSVLRRRPGWPRHGARAGGALALAVVVAGPVVGPVVDAQSRRVEAAADARARELGADPAAQVRLVRGFVVDGRSDPDPPTWVRLVSATHPTPRERILAAVAAADAAGLALPDLEDVRAEEARRRAADGDDEGDAVAGGRP